MNRRLLLLRYDVESGDAAQMEGFLARVVSVHRESDLPVTLFCTGGAIEARANAFRKLVDAIGDDPRFEIGDHSYSHIGIGYERGQPLDVLRADYERSFAAHAVILGRLPDAVSICGTGGKDGARLPGFDATPKARLELEMLAAMGVRRINTMLTGVDESSEFTSFARMGLPAVEGFPSGFSDTSWLRGAEKDSDFLAPIRAEIDRRADANLPMPVVLHDWVTWNHAPDRDLTHILQIADYARQRGFVPATTREALRIHSNEVN